MKVIVYNLFLVLVTSLENITVSSALCSDTHRVAAAAQHSDYQVLSKIPLVLYSRY